MDAGDAGIVDAGIDVPQSVDTSPGIDAVVEASTNDAATGDAVTSDAPPVSCSTASVDPTPFFSNDDIGFLYQEDETAVGGSPGTLNAQFRVEVPQAVPTMTSGDCVYFPITRGSTARLNGQILNLGTVTFSQPPGSWVWTFSSSLMRYSADPAPTLTNLLNGFPVYISIAGGPDGPPGMASLIVPPLVDFNTFTASFTDPANPTLPSTSDTVVTWNPPPDIAPDVVVSLVAYDQLNGANRDLLLCAVPACRGTMTIPHFVSALSTGRPGPYPDRLCPDDDNSREHPRGNHPFHGYVRRPLDTVAY